MADSTQLPFARSAHDGCRWRGEAASAEQATGSYPGGLPRPEGERRFIWIPWIAFILLALLLPACGVSTVPLTVQIRDASTHEPITGAAVEANSLALGASLAPDDVVDELFGRRTSHSSKAMTDAQGAARVEYIQGRAVRVTVWRVGGSPASALLSPGGPADRTWSIAMQSPPNSGEIEVSAWPEKVP